MTIKTDSIKKKFPCASKIIIDSLIKISSYQTFSQPFIGTGPNLEWDSQPLSWNTNNSNIYELGNTAGTGYSALITLNTNMLQNSSQLLIAAAAIHETIHAYINYNLQSAHYDVADNKVTVSSFLYGIDVWYTIYGIPSNFSDHYTMLDNYFDQAVQTLAQWDNNQHNIDQYRMTMLYGLNQASYAGTAAATYSTRLQTEYQNLLTRFNFTQAQLDSFYLTQLNSSTNKLPTTGCN